jgi:hypothetical protein
MKNVVEVLLLALALGAAVLAGSRHARRHEHPHYVHHSIGFIIVAVVAGVSLLFFGPN